ncbi:hypothetical protein DVDV_3354 [Desulfovibrio sp. DV]|uniref:hypothetical protein n=1 Tax=Desulfovibrio sp. DV TaxID=1844708 RepID=UPI00094B7C2E|nr:hypothetical protein [Desulfovibrio sp. DV]OLN25425.1 hypothetical protein DVDV_3354 [Desulfovibrio sp. DV]
MIRLFTALVFVLLLASSASAQSFGPKTYPDCTMLYVKRAASRDGKMLVRRACKCRFQDQNDPECKGYSQKALDCIITNVLPVEHDEEVWGVERACRTKHPVQ